MYIHQICSKKSNILPSHNKCPSRQCFMVYFIQYILVNSSCSIFLCKKTVMEIASLSQLQTHGQNVSIHPMKTVLGLPRSEHCTTRRWHWQRKGHTGPNPDVMESSVGGISADPSSSSIKSKRPCWWNGVAKHAGSSRTKRRASLMAQFIHSGQNLGIKAGDLQQKQQFPIAAQFLLKEVQHIHQLHNCSFQ